ncbi:hypothetical protein H4R19_003606 [Coemansia spiralis]|nr:hypothetical protein H4R19_003606 [Coemansia spiralis]
MHVVPLSDKVITFSEGHVEVAVQSPAPLATVLTDAPPPHDAETDDKAVDSAAGARPAVMHLELETPPVTWSHIGKLLRLSGYWAVAAVAVCKIAGVYATFYADTLRIGLMVDSNPATMAQSLQHYLLLNALIQIGRQQLYTFECWLRRAIWLKPLGETTRQQSLDLLLSMQLQWYERLSSMATLNMFYGYRNATAFRLPVTLCDDVIGGGMTALSGVVQAAMVAPRVFWISVPLSVMVYLAHRYVTAVSRALDRHKEEADRPRRRKTVDILFYNTLHRIHGSSAGALRSMRALEAVVLSHCQASQAVESAHRLTSAVLSELVRSAALLFSLQQRIIWGHDMSAGKVDAETTLLLDVLSRIGDVATASRTAEDQLQRLARYFQATETLPREPPRVVEGCRPSAAWPESGRIEFQAYNMRYQHDMDLVLKDMSFSVGAKEKIGIVGRTGAGKSSLAQAIMRMVEPDSGRVLIDDIDTATIGVHDLRSRISVIPQDPALFSGTIRDNLDPMHEYTDAEIWRAIRTAKIDHLVEKPSGTYEEQPDYDLFNEDKGRWVEGVGLAKWVCRGGSNFSVGQRQQVSICRALLWQRRILVLDEATANIDGETDQAIQSVLRSEFKECTVLTIAHRLDTVMDCDRILVMDQGRAVEFDTPASLLTRDGQFAQLVERMRVSQGR